MSQAKVAAPYVPLTASNLTPEQLAELKRNFQKTLVQATDMSSEVQSEAIDLIVSAIDNIKANNGTYEQAARSVKDSMDRKFGQSWHCIIGEGFGFECTAQDKSMLYLYYQGTMGILLFKC